MGPEPLSKAFCQTPDQTGKKNQIKTKIWRGSIIAWFLSLLLAFLFVTLRTVLMLL